MPFVVTTWPDGSVFINGECILRKGVPVPSDSDDDERLVNSNGMHILGMRDPNIGFARERRTATKPRKPRTDIRVTLAQRGFLGSYEYICIDRPPWAARKRKGEKDKAQHARASQDPAWKWTMMRETCELLAEHSRLVTFCNPSNFDMRFGNIKYPGGCTRFDDGEEASDDFFGYGIIQLIEKFLQIFHASLYGKELNFQKMWLAISGLAHFLNDETHGDVWMRISSPWLKDRMLPICSRITSLCEIIGCALLTALNRIEMLDELGPVSQFRDLGLVMALFMTFSQRAPSTIIHREGVNWQHTLKAYALKACINLANQGVANVKRVVDSIKVEPLEGKATATRWNWRDNIASYRGDHADTNALGGWYNTFNILRMQSDDRRERHINKQDPLQHYYPHEMKGLLKGEVQLDQDRICRVNCETCAKRCAEHAAWMEELQATRLMQIEARRGTFANPIKTTHPQLHPPSPIHSSSSITFSLLPTPIQPHHLRPLLSNPIKTTTQMRTQLNRQHRSIHNPNILNPINLQLRIHHPAEFLLHHSTRRNIVPHTREFPLHPSLPSLIAGMHRNPVETRFELFDDVRRQGFRVEDLTREFLGGELEFLVERVVEV
ncbi:hypothetical protein AC578_5590 [Pseudocercospora eumusae]|uniref:4Fe-4S ferredoxin-type domain-containing protein n=1 Tax=Pseudocercospora eumusae TaxID=321146 RepID=A0A139HTM5_9PEZI|nr:hypothetical protein AC578_5590 [Pseudocercospora eumusae]